MIREYLSKLSPDIQAFVLDIERDSGITIEVEIDDSRLGSNLGEPDPLACIVSESEARLLIPSTREFSDGSVLHELLHIHRFLVEQVPQIVVCEDRWDPNLERIFTQMDNNLEHLVIVPIEIQRRPSRRDRWMVQMQRTLDNTQSGKLLKADQEFLAIYCRLFVDHVLEDIALRKRTDSILDYLELSHRANEFSRSVLPALSSKETTTQIVVDLFNLDPSFICLNYMNSKNRSCQQTSVL